MPCVKPLVRDDDFAVQVETRTAPQDHAVRADFALDVATPCRDLTPHQMLALQPLRPIRSEQAVRRARNRVLVDTQSGREATRNEIECIPGSGNDGAGHCIFQEAKIGAKCPQLSFALQHQEMVGSPLQATPDLGAQRPDKVRRSRHGPGRTRCRRARPLFA